MRLLRKWVEHPLLNVKEIVRRQNAVTELFENFMLREEIGELLSHVLDLERLMTKVVYGSANAKDLRAICATISVLPELKSLLNGCTSDELVRIRESMDLLEDIRDLIDEAIVEDPPFLIREGKMIKEGYNPDVDRLREIMNDGKGWIESRHP